MIKINVTLQIKSQQTSHLKTISADRSDITYRHHCTSDNSDNNIRGVLYITAVVYHCIECRCISLYRMSLYITVQNVIFTVL